MKQIKGVIFDFNGTLFFDGPKHLAAWTALVEEVRDTPLSEEEKELVVGPPNLHILKTLFPQISEREAKRLSARKEAIYRALCKQDPAFTHLVKGAQALFDELKKQQIPFTIASASIAENIRFFISTFHLDRWIEPSMIVYDDGYHKDKSAMYWHAARNLRVPPQNCIIFEDSLSGIRHAKAVSAALICALGDAHLAPKQKQAGADLTIADFDQFDRALLK